jgi:hypothetical protein
MKQVDKISVAELTEMSKSMYDGLVKAVVDIDKKIVAVDAEMHVDEEQYLLENGSKQGSLWGINLYPADFGTDSFVEFDSMINLRPSHGNRSRSVEDTDTQVKIKEIIKSVVYE